MTTGHTRHFTPGLCALARGVTVGLAAMQRHGSIGMRNPRPRVVQNALIAA